MFASDARPYITRTRALLPARFRCGKARFCYASARSNPAMATGPCLQGLWKTPRPPWKQPPGKPGKKPWRRSEEHTSELQSRPHLVCRLLLEKKKKKEYETY